MHINYQREKDSFYLSLLDEGYDDLDIMDPSTMTFSHQQFILSRIINSPYLMYNESITAMDIISLILVHVPFVTKAHLDKLQLLSESGLTNILSRAQSNRKRPLLKSLYVGSDKMKIYYLPYDVKNDKITSLPDEYISTHKLSTSDRITSSGNYAHGISLISLYMHWLSTPEFCHFEWFSPVNMQLGSSIEDCLLLKSTIQSNALSPDAVARDIEHDRYLLIEQDMRTESQAVLQDKFNRYVLHLLSQAPQKLATLSMLFTIQTQVSKPSSTRPTSLTPGRLSSAYKLIDYAMHENPSLTITEMMEDLDEFMNNPSDGASATVRNRKSLMYRFLLEVIKFNPDATALDDAKQYLDYSVQQQNKQKERRAYIMQQKLYRSRIDVIRKAASRSVGFDKLLKKGFSLYSVSTAAFTDLPYLLLREYGTIDTLMQIAIDKHIMSTFKALSYEPLATITNDANEIFYLRNSIKSIEHPNVNFIFENISQDLGGYTRVSNYLVNGAETSHYTFLYLLVSNENDAYEFDNKFHVSTTYYDGEDPYRALTNVHIVYFCYQIEKSIYEPFIVSNNKSYYL